MLQIKKEKDPSADVGVIVGRFQVPDLHEAHVNLIKSVLERHNKVIIFLGLSPIFDSKDPLDFEARKLMINEAFPTIIVSYISDMRDNDKWSVKLDEQIKQLVGPKQSVLLYGGRESFISSYGGRHRTAELVQDHWVSGTEIRTLVKNSVENNKSFRHGAIWSTWQRYDTVYTTVDIAPINKKTKQVLLGRKPNEDKFRFIGGFVDPKDKSNEAAAMRELGEEAPGAEYDVITSDHYLGSFNVNDWRYRGKPDRIRTLFYYTTHLFGVSKAGDDIAEIKWFDIRKFTAIGDMNNLVPEHHDMMDRLIEKLDDIIKK